MKERRCVVRLTWVGRRGGDGGESKDSRPVCQSVNKDKAVFIY